MFIVVYRAHNLPNFSTDFYGPYETHDEAYDKLCELPAVGIKTEPTEDEWDNTGCKYIAECVK